MPKSLENRPNSLIRFARAILAASIILTVMKSLPAHASATQRCEALFSSLHRIVNPSASLKGDEYTQPNGRGQRSYRDVLLPEGRAFEDFLRAGDVVIDIGGGQGLAMRELSENIGVHAIVINTQDFSLMHSRPRRQGSVEFRVGWAEEVLPLMKSNSADAMVDVYGGTTYSPLKNVMIEESYRILKPGRSALIYFNEQRVPTWVQRRGEFLSIPFVRYLVERYPDIIRVRQSDRNEGSVIEITKPASGAPELIDLRLKVRRVNEIPNSVFNEVSFVENAN